MKISKVLLTLSFCSLLVSCSQEHSTSSISDFSDDYSSESTSSSADSSESSESSSSSSEDIFQLEDLLTLANKAKEKSSLIGDGVVKLTRNDSYSEKPTINEMPFEFGKDKYGDVLHYVSYDFASNKSDSYVMKNSSGDIIAVNKDSDGAISKSFESFDEVNYPYRNLLGYGINTTYFGSESLLSGLLELLNKNVNKDAQYSYQDEKYQFSFGYFESLDTWNYYVVSSYFKIGESNN